VLADCPVEVREGPPATGISKWGWKATLPLYADNVAKPHRFEHASLLVFDVDPVIEICATVLSDRFREGKSGVFTREIMRCLEIGELSSVHVTSINVVVKVEKIPGHYPQSAAPA
jgi:hypothetical protein